MSYFKKSPFDVTPGTAFEAFQAGTRSPMLPQAYYNPAGAGPASLTGLGAHVYYAEQRTPRIPFRGLGDPITDMLGQATSQGAVMLVEAMWPPMQARLQEEFKPLKLALGAIAVASVASATFAFLAWRKGSTSYA